MPVDSAPHHIVTLALAIWLPVAYGVLVEYSHLPFVLEALPLTWEQAQLANRKVSDYVEQSQVVPAWRYPRLADSQLTLGHMNKSSQNQKNHAANL